MRLTNCSGHIRSPARGGASSSRDSMPWPSSTGWRAAIAGEQGPVGLRWYRALPLDAAVVLPGGRTVGVVRAGTDRRSDGVCQAAVEAARIAAHEWGTGARLRRDAPAPLDQAARRRAISFPGRPGEGRRRDRTGRPGLEAALDRGRHRPSAHALAHREGRFASGGEETLKGLHARGHRGRRTRG